MLLMAASTSQISGTQGIPLRRREVRSAGVG
jgi:hypothetical protein